MNKILQAIRDTYQEAGYCVIPQNTIQILHKTFHIPTSKVAITSCSTINRDILLETRQGNRLCLTTDHLCRTQYPTILFDIGFFGRNPGFVPEIILSKKTINACAQWLQSHAKEKLQAKLRPFIRLLPITIIKTPTVGRQPHVDCPLQKRKDPQYQSSFANPDFECEYCPFCLDVTFHDVSCLGAQFLDDYQDFSLSLAQRRQKYYQHTELCPECGELSFMRCDGKYGEYWRCAHCRTTISNRKLIYQKMEEEHRYFMDSV